MIFDVIRYDIFVTAVGLPPGGSSSVHIYTQQYTERHKQYIEQHKNIGRVRAVPRLCGLNPGICLTTEEKAKDIAVHRNHQPKAATTYSLVLICPTFRVSGQS
jgi:hypothetical protein